MKTSIGQAGIRLMGDYSNTTAYRVAQAVKDTYGNWWVSKKGTDESPNKGNALPTVTNGKQSASEWWLLMINYQDVAKAISDANTAKTGANNAASSANSAAENATKKAALAEDVAMHPPKIGDDGLWYFYDPTTKTYVKTEFLAKGQVEFPTFSVDTNTMQVQVELNEGAANRFAVDSVSGQLFVVLG